MLVSILFLSLQSILAFHRPKYFLLVFLIYSSSFLGFFPKEILFGTNDIGLFYQTFLMILSYFIYLRKMKHVEKYVVYLLNVILLLYVVGIILPIATGSSSFLQSIVASKEFSSLFLLHYLIIHRRHFFQSYLEKVLTGFGYYFLFVLVVYVLFNYTPPEYSKESSGIEFDYPSFLSLFLFVLSAITKQGIKKIGVLCLIGVWSVGMFYEGHVAIMVTTSLGCLIVLFRITLLRFIRNIRTVFVGLGAAALCLFLLPGEKIIQAISANSAFVSRSVYNEKRFEMIAKSPFFGHGFLHKSVLQFSDSNVYMESLSFIDSGYVDLLGKFGFIGMIVYLVFLTIPFFRGKTDLLGISLRLFFLQYFLVCITWSVFSYSMGTIALSLALFMYYRNSEYLKLNSENG